MPHELPKYLIPKPTESRGTLDVKNYHHFEPIEHSISLDLEAFHFREKPCLGHRLSPHVSGRRFDFSLLFPSLSSGDILRLRVPNADKTDRFLFKGNDQVPGRPACKHSGWFGSDQGGREYDLKERNVSFFCFGTPWSMHLQIGASFNY